MLKGRWFICGGGEASTIGPGHGLAHLPDLTLAKNGLDLPVTY
jgi:hypothetical protein